MFNRMIKENQSMKYRVMLHGRVFTECASYEIANNAITALPKEQQEHASIVPVTNEGKQILNETSFV
jgi:hypothetical protein